MSDVVAFLRARLDEQEKIARRAAALCGCHPPAAAWLFHGDENDGRITIRDDPHPVRHGLGRRWNRTHNDMFAAAHIALNDPAYVLADIAAKRRTIGLHAEPHECVTWDISGGWTCTGYFGGDDPCLTLRHLALSDAAHPDFDPVWAV
jgi:hypothetical protein